MVIMAVDWQLGFMLPKSFNSLSVRRRLSWRSSICASVCMYVHSCGEQFLIPGYISGPICILDHVPV